MPHRSSSIEPAAPAAAGRPGYLELTPARVLDAVDAVGLRPDGRLLQLNSYENRVHQLYLEDGRAVVTKFYRPRRWSDAQILEEHRFSLELAEAEVGVVAPLTLSAPAASPVELLGGAAPTLACWTIDGERHRFGVWPRRAGREPALDDPATLERLGGFIGRLHAVGRRRAFEHRLTMQPAADAAAALARLDALQCVTPTEAPAWRAAAQACVQGIERAFAAHGPCAALRLHGDCHLGNVLWREEGAHVVDLDDALQGPAVQDLWMLAGADAERTEAAWHALLAGYCAWADFDRRELALVEPLRTLRMLRHAAWLAERWHDPAFPLAFPFFGTPAYWSQQTTQLREQLAAMEAALGASAA